MSISGALYPTVFATMVAVMIDLSSATFTNSCGKAKNLPALQSCDDQEGCLSCTSKPNKYNSYLL